MNIILNSAESHSLLHKNPLNSKIIYIPKHTYFIKHKKSA